MGGKKCDGAEVPDCDLCFVSERMIKNVLNLARPTIQLENTASSQEMKRNQDMYKLVSYSDSVTLLWKNVNIT